MNKKVNNRIIKFAPKILFCIVILGIYILLFMPNVNREVIVYIPSNCSFKKLKDIVYPHIDNKFLFDIVVKLKKYDKNIRAGKYILKPSYGNNKIINVLRTKNEEIDLVFNNQEIINDLAGRIAKQIEADSLSILNELFNSKTLNENNLTKENIISIFIPNTYKFYWNTSAEKFVKRMLNEYKSFWNNERKEKAKQINLSPLQIIILASIVQKEASMVEERRRVAGLYINRLNKKIKLQSDPTVIYAIKKEKGFDIQIKRVLLKHLEFKSPYNTYINYGLPPAPICIPDISSIDAILNYERHSYIYMCASVDKLGYHNFARTLVEHNRYREIYINWLNKQNIK